MHEGAQTNEIDMLQRVYSEVLDMKGTIDKMSTKMESVDKKIESMQTENKQWSDKLVNVEAELNGVKDSIEMAHRLIDDGKSEREEMRREMKNESTERTRAMSNNASVLKNHGTELKSVKDEMKTLHVKMLQIAKEQSDLK